MSENGLREFVVSQFAQIAASAGTKIETPLDAQLLASLTVERWELMLRDEKFKHELAGAITPLAQSFLDCG